jgi:hypothetical protein
LLLEAAVEVNPDQLEVVAGVVAADAARITVPARLQRVDSDPLTCLELVAAVRAERGDRPRELVSLNPREL